MTATLPILVTDWQKPEDSLANKPVIGVPMGSYIDIAMPHVKAQFEMIIGTIKHMGAIVKPIILCDDIASHNDTHDLIANAELYQIHKSWVNDYWEIYKPMSRAALEFGRNVSIKHLLKVLIRSKKCNLGCSN